MLRRSFLHHAGVAAPALLAAQQQRTSDPRLAELTPRPKPAIAMNHLGFLPKARKCVLYRLSGGAEPREFMMREIGSGPPFRMISIGTPPNSGSPTTPGISGPTRFWKAIGRNAATGRPPQTGQMVIYE
jgi:hypothetical protein